MVLLRLALFRAGFEPLSWRRDHGPSLRIESRSVFLGGINITPQLKTGADRRGKGTEPWARRVFRPTVPGSLRRFAHTPICAVPSSSSLNSSPCHGSLADLEPSKDRTVCLYRERMQESDGRRPF